MSLKTLGGGGIDGHFGVNPDWSTIEVKTGRTIWSSYDDNTLQAWLVEDTNAGGVLLAGGNYANPIQIAGNGLPRIAGYFASGFVFENPNQVGIDVSGNSWQYVGTSPLPYTVTAGTMPSAPDYEKVFESTLQNLNGLEQPSDLDKVIVRTRTSYQAIAEDAPVGTRYIFTDLDNARYDIVDNSDAGGYYYTAMASGRKLKYVPIDVISLEGMGINTTNSDVVINAADTIANSLGLKIVARNKNTQIRISSSAQVSVDTDIRCDIVLADGASFNIVTDGIEETVDFSLLSGTDVFSSKITGFPLSAVGKTILIESNSILTERLNPPTNTPYYKNTAFTLLDSDGNISPTLDMTFSAGDNPTVSVLPDDKPTSVKLGRVYVEGASGDVYSQIRVLRSNVDLSVGSTESEGTQNANSISVDRCGGTKLTLGIGADTQYDGLGYCINIGLSTDTTIDGGKFIRNRASIDGRHGSNVKINNVIAGRVGSHWGNNYVFTDCDIKEVSYSGKDLSFVRGSGYGPYFISVRNDVYKTIGKLTVEGTTLRDTCSRLMSSSSSIPVEGETHWTEVRESFNEIDIDSVTIESDGAFTLLSYDNTPPLKMTKTVNVNNINKAGSGEVYLFSIGAGNKIEEIESGSRYTFTNIDSAGLNRVSFGSSTNVLTERVDFIVRDISGTFDFRSYGDYLGYNNTFDNVYLVRLARINASTGGGEIKIINSTIDNPAFFLEVGLHLVSCEYVGSVGEGSATTILSQTSCRAKLGATDYKTPLNYYVDPLYYETL